MSAANPLSLPAPRPSPSLIRIGAVLAGVGAVVSAATLLPSGGRVVLGYGYLVGFAFAWTVLLGCLFFVGLQHLTHARWSVVVRRAAEMLVSPIWLLAVLFLPIAASLVAGDMFHLFPWADARRVAEDPLVRAKAAYLNVGFFLARAAAFFAVWLAFARIFVRTSLAQDDGTADSGAALRLRKLAAPLVVLFGLSATFAGLDWLMSLEPRWYSTMFGVYVFAGMMVSALAAVTLVLLGLLETGRIGAGWVRRDHLYNLGALMFAFTCFWGYIAFSQFMLIWYGHMPEETFYFAERFRGDWRWLSLLLPIVRFALPFGILLARPSKSDPRALRRAAVIVLAGQLLDLFWLVAPQMEKNAPEELARSISQAPWMLALMLGPVCLVSGLVLLQVARFLARHSPVAVGDPLVDESRQFHL